MLTIITPLPPKQICSKITTVRSHTSTHCPRRFSSRESPLPAVFGHIWAHVITGLQQENVHPKCLLRFCLRDREKKNTHTYTPTVHYSKIVGGEKNWMQDKASQALCAKAGLEFRHALFSLHFLSSCNSNRVLCIFTGVSLSCLRYLGEGWALHILDSLEVSCKLLCRLWSNGFLLVLRQLLDRWGVVS